MKNKLLKKSDITITKLSKMEKNSEMIHSNKSHYLKQVFDDNQEVKALNKKKYSGFFENKMLCRLMNTKRDNFWNELHKLDKKRINNTLNEFIIKKDHEAMKFILMNHEKEKNESLLKDLNKQKKIQKIKNFKENMRLNKKKNLSNLEKKNYQSVLKYLENTKDFDIDHHQRKHILLSPDSKKNAKIKPQAILSSYKKKINFGNDILFNKLSKINQTFNEKVTNIVKKNSLKKVNIPNYIPQESKRLSIRTREKQNLINYFSDFNKLYVKEALKVKPINF